MTTIEIPDDWLESMDLSPEAAKAYLLSGYPVMKEICLFHMTSTIIRTPLNSILAYAQIIRKGLDGPVTEQQVEHLENIIHSAEFLFEHLTTFINVVSSVYNRHRIYLTNFDIKEIVYSEISFVTKHCEFEIDYHIPDDILTIRSDQILFGNLLFGMMEIAKRIRPTYKGKISIFIEQIDEHVEIEVTLLEDAEYPFRLSDDNPEIFMAHSLAKKLKGRFRIEQQNSSWKIIALLPIENE